MKKKLAVCLIGATGKLGSKVYQQLKNKNIDLIPLVRKPSGLENEVVCDFSLPILKDILKKTDIIINVAGSIKTYDKKNMDEANVDLVRKIIEAAPEKAKIIHASSIAVYGKNLAKKPADEQTPIKPDSDYARTKYEAEKILAGHKNTVILRIGTIYNESDNYASIMEKIANGKMYIIGDGNNNIPFVHEDDAAVAFVLALKAPPGVYNIVGDPITQIEAYTIAASVLGVKPPIKHIPFWLANLAALFDEKLNMLFSKKPKITGEQVAILYFDRVFDCTLAKKILGFNPRKNTEGVREVANKIKRRLRF